MLKPKMFKPIRGSTVGDSGEFRYTNMFKQMFKYV